MTRLLWLPMLLYMGWVVQQAHTELNDDYVIQGLFRTYQPPAEVPEGWLIDARPGGLLDELRVRYGRPGLPSLEPPDDGPTHWHIHLNSLGISAQPTQGTGATPRLLFLPGGTWLQTGTFQGQPVVFDPRRGVILLADGALAPDVAALELLDVHERPW